MPRLFSAIANFFKRLFNKNSEPELALLIEENSSESKSIANIETGIDKLKKLRVLVRRFETFFPDKYNEYLVAINTLEAKWISDLKQYENSIDSDELSSAVNPTQNLDLNETINSLDYEINDFVENDVLIAIINSRLDKYIDVVRHLYNAITKDINSKYVPERIKEATDKLDEIMSEVINSDDDCYIIKSNTNLYEKFYEAKYWVAKIIVITDSYISLEQIFDKDERTSYMHALFKDLDSLKSRVSVFDDSKRYEKLKLDLNRIVNLNFIMPQENVLISKKFWLDFLEIEKTIAKEEKNLKKFKSKNHFQSDNTTTTILSNHFSNIKLKEKVCDINSIFTRDIAFWLENLQISNETIDLLAKIFKYIDSKIPVNDVYFFITLFEVRHIIYEYVMQISQQELIGLKLVFQEKYVDESYDKLHVKKQAVFDTKSDNSEYLKILSCFDKEDCDNISKILSDLLIDAITLELHGEFVFCINRIYFSHANYLEVHKNNY